ncbi:hypothetical protein QUC31_013104 [Theobroma cacao]
MVSFHISMTLSFCIFLSLLCLNSEAAVVFLDFHCGSNTTTYTRNSTYQRNLNFLLSSLQSNTTRESGFYNLTVGRDPPDIVYGLFLCRGDVTQDICQECVSTASGEILRRCPNQKTALLYYDECTLRYSNRSFFSELETEPSLQLLNTGNVSQPDRFMELLANTTKEIAARAAADQSGKKFATEEANFTNFQTLYTLAQCTPDLSVSSCDTCLTTAISFLPSCCLGKQGGRVVFPSCNVRYELYPFYRITAQPPSPTPVRPSPPAPQSKSKGGRIETQNQKREKARASVFLLGNERSTMPWNKKTGKLPSGQEIAVKRLSGRSSQGAEEYKNEVWKHWNNGTPLELLDSSLRSSYSSNEVIRCIHIGLLCVQEDPAERPTMAAIVLMLNSYSVTLQAPQAPATFFIPRTDMASLHSYIIFMLLVILLSFSSEAAPTYSSYACDNSTTFTPNSTYQANIKTLLSSLSSNISSSKNGFYNTTAGQDPNLVYGTFLCRGDVSANLCQDCVASASNEIAQRCLTEKMGVIWYDECTVRYSDQNIFSIIREVPGMDNSSSASITDKESFDQLLASVMKILANRAAYEDQSGKKFAAGKANFTSSQTLYSLVQCTPDLTDALCFRCFQSAIATLPTCCDGKQGARVLLPSCNIRYEMFPFYQLNGTDSTVLVPSPPSTNSTKEKTKTSTKTIIAIAVPVVVSVVLFAAGFCLLTRNRKKYDAVEQENGKE